MMDILPIMPVAKKEKRLTETSHGSG